MLTSALRRHGWNFPALDSAFKMLIEAKNMTQIGRERICSIRHHQRDRPEVRRLIKLIYILSLEHRGRSKYIPENCSQILISTKANHTHSDQQLSMSINTSPQHNSSTSNLISPSTPQTESNKPAINHSEKQTTNMQTTKIILSIRPFIHFLLLFC